MESQVVRVAVLTLKNLVTRPNLASDMVDAGLPKSVQILKQQAWSDEVQVYSRSD